jgi:ubiquinone/menaquinone biosynthesis C-methylase UbiE
MKEHSIPPEIVRHYEAGVERGRLERGGGYLELIRTQEILKRFMPRLRADVLDVGGGPGVYSKWLAELGHHVTLVDAVPSHVKQALAIAGSGRKRLFSAELGDARELRFPDASFSAVLMFGPLYHLTRRGDRIRALKEARRVLRPRGLLFAAAISRYASLVDGLKRRFLDDPDFRKIVERDLREGQHRNPSGHEYYFTTSYFHHPDELAQEVAEAGFRLNGIYAVEGLAEILHGDDLDKRLRRAATREQILRFIAVVETEPSLLGVSSHLLAVAYAS